MKLLLISDMAQTGFGRVGRELATGMLARGWDVRVVGVNWRGVDGEIAGAIRPGEVREQMAAVRTAADQLEADPLTDLIMPASVGGDVMGHGLTGPAFRGTLWDGWRPDAAIVVADPKAMWDRLNRDGGGIAEAAKRGVVTWNYVPIEGGGLPGDWAPIWRLTRPVAMSAFGADQLKRLLGHDVPVIPHGVSPAFRPLSPADPGEWRGVTVTTPEGAKTALGLHDRIVILRTDRFVIRKNYPALFRVLRPVLAAHPEAVAIMHTTPYDDIGRGTLWQLISREEGAVPVGLVSGRGETVWEHPQWRITGWHDSFRGLSDEELRVLYCTADMVVSPTMAEGFGLTLAETAACGVPIVATDYSAVPEVVGPGAILAPVDRLWTNEYAHDWALVDEPAMTAAVERLIAKPSLRREIGAAGRRHVARFTWTACVEGFDLLLRTSLPVSEEAPALVG